MQLQASDFWARVNFDGPIGTHAPHLGNCWTWKPKGRAEGYGKYWGGARQWLAHRMAFALTGRTLVADKEIDHLCRVRDCVRPSHLEQVTGKVNKLRGASFAAINARKVVCIRGHALGGANVHVLPSGARRCRSCHALREAARRKAA